MSDSEWYNKSWSKRIGDFDAIELVKLANSDWTDLRMHVGNDAKLVEMTFRSREAVEDLRYALDRLLDIPRSGYE